MPGTRAERPSEGFLVRRPLRVLQSFPEPRPTTNPYVVMLRRALDATPGVDVQTFAWSRALWSRYDVFHAHWPEILLSGRDPFRRLVRRALVAAFVLRLWITRTAVVRTAHNLAPHAPISRVESYLLRRLERRTALVIRLNDQTPVPPGLAARSIPHGHYRDWFAGHPLPRPTPRHVAFVGLVKPYKNVESLIAAVRDAIATAPDVTLQVAGQPDDPELAESLRRAAQGVPQITLRLEHLDDADLVDAVCRAQLVVLPYRELHNSGAALLALSLDRSILLPDNEVTGRLAAEVGAGWVLRYDGDLTAGKLLSALGEAGSLPAGARPDLSGREWDDAGTAHLSAYREALTVGRTRRSRPG
jgi:beta-1,4-mannosyltransferase